MNHNLNCCACAITRLKEYEDKEICFGEFSFQHLNPEFLKPSQEVTENEAILCLFLRKYGPIFRSRGSVVRQTGDCLAGSQTSRFLLGFSRCFLFLETPAFAFWACIEKCNCQESRLLKDLVNRPHRDRDTEPSYSSPQLCVF